MDKTGPKPSKTTLVCWIDHKYLAMEHFKQHFGLDVTLGTARTDRFASSKMSKDLGS